MSFKEKTEFNFLTAEEVKTHDNHVFKAENGLELTRFAAMYGANGSGKSNLVKAMQVFKDIVNESFAPSYLNNIYSDLVYFKLAEGYDKKATFFEIECFLKGSFWIFGFEVMYQTIIQEWLYETFPFDESQDRMIYKRHEKDIQWGEGIGIDLPGPLINTHIGHFVSRAEQTPKPPIKEGAAWDTYYLFEPIANFIRNWVVVYPETSPHFISFNMDRNSGMKKWVHQLLTISGIKRLEVKETQPMELFALKWKEEIERLNHILDEGTAVELLEMPVPAYAQKVNGEIKLKRLVTVHQPEGQDEKAFELYQESDGTKRILELAMETYNLVDAEANNHVPRLLIIDEIENSLHVHLIRHMLYALSRSTELKGQLLFTTHDTHLLDPRLFRPDEIWFAKKNGAEATELYPMSDIKLYEGEDWEISYLAGRFGGIPNPIAFI